ncbi:MAG: M20 metallopeptidase family protein, partial [Bacillota bacterium]
MKLISGIKKEIEHIREDLIDWRRQIHRHPETGFEEEKTSQMVREKLEDWGYRVTQVAGTGVVGLLEGKKSGKTIAIRADMDALNLEEKTGLEYSSEVPGKMHACGHDGHTAMALGAARVLAGFRDRLEGNVKFLFQPAEEGPGGAQP